MNAPKGQPKDRKVSIDSRKPYCVSFLCLKMRQHSTGFAPWLDLGESTRSDRQIREELGLVI
jgi:hypothetical protein